MVNLNAAAWKKDVSRSTGKHGDIPAHIRTWEATIQIKLLE
jgi:hypothetical protein